MADSAGRLRAFLAELKRRKVYQVAAVYVVVAITGLELVDLVIPASRLPDWADELFLGLALLGFPLALVLAWAFDVTPDGLTKTVANVRAADPRDGHDDIAARATLPSEAEAAATALDARAVAVLPFDNLSGTTDAEPFAAGLHDDLLTELSRVSALTVISRTSVKACHGSGKSISEIARELGVGTVVEGGVQKAGDRVRLNIQLIDARTGVQYWAERYDRQLTASNIFDIQSELARKIAATVHAELTSEESARLDHQPTKNLEAYRLYALGREALQKWTEGGMHEAAGHFERATELDPDYALAWTGLGTARVLLYDYRFDPSESLLPRGEDAIQRALRLDPTLAEAHAALGCLHSARREGREALRSHGRAVELRPSYSAAHKWLCWVRLLVGDPHEARVAGLRSARLDPLDPEASGNLAMAHLGCGDAEQALAEARRTLKGHAEYDYSRWTEGLVLYHLARDDEATAVLQRVSEPWARFWPGTARALAAAVSGDEATAHTILASLAKRSAHFHVGLVHAALGEADAAFVALERAGQFAWAETLYLRYPPPNPLDGLREDPRFAQLLLEVDRSWGLKRG